MGNAGMDKLVELTEFDRPHPAAFADHQLDDGNLRTLTFTTDADATVMVWDWQVAPKGWFRRRSPGGTDWSTHGAQDLDWAEALT